MTKNNCISQSVYFDKGPYDGKVAILAIPKPFRGGMVLSVDGSKYQVTNGPAAMIVERTQSTFEQGAVRAAYMPADDAIECYIQDRKASATLSERKEEKAKCK